MHQLVFSYRDKIPEIHSLRGERESLFWLMVLESSVHGLLTNAETSWQKNPAEEICSTYGNREAESRSEKGRDWGPGGVLEAP